MKKITADIETLINQAPITANVYLAAAVNELDDLFGEGYSRKHPELVAAYMQTCAMGLGAAAITSALQDVASAIE